MTDTTNPLFSQAVCLLVEFRRLGTRRKVATNQIDTKGADETMIHVSKDILESKELDAIISGDNELRTFVRKHATPSPMFRGGIELLRNSLIPKVDAKIVEYDEYRRGVLVPAFLAKYEELKAAARVRLGPHFNATQYPPVNVVEGAFGIRWQYFTVDTPGTLEEIRADIFAREQEKAEQHWSDALEEANAVLLASFSDLVAHMVDRLLPADDGKPKVFRNSLVVNLKEFLSTFGDRNIGQDAQLAAEVAKAGNLLAGIEPDDLRKHAPLRDTVTAGFATIKTTLDAMMMERPSRRYAADNEE